MIVCSLHLPWYFFFQAEDGIRDATVTGVQTCALPIYPDVQCDLADLRLVEIPDRVDPRRHVAELCAVPEEELGLVARPDNDSVRPRARSEERRVGKEWRMLREREHENGGQYRGSCEVV